MWWKKWVYRDPEPNSFMSLYQHKTDVKILNVKVVRVHWTHLLCNNFNSLPSSSSAIITAWVIRQFSNNEKAGETEEIMYVSSKPWDVQHSLFRPVVLLQKWSDLQKKSQNCRYHLRHLAGLSYSSPKTSSSSYTSL